MMNRIRWVWTLVFVAVFALASQTVSSLGYCQEASKARLQLINGTDETVEVYWIKSQQDRVHQGSIEPGKNKVIHTTIGHRFAVTNRADREIGEIESRVRVQAFRIGGVPKFYTQRILANGFEIVASDVVNPYALKEAAYIIDGMLGNRPDVREAMIQSGSRLCILGWNEYTTDQPEWQWLAHEQNPEFLGILGRDYYDARARGMGGSQSDPYCSCGEENLLCYPGDPYSTENILIHELAHNIHLRGMVNVDPTFDRRVRAAYDQAVESGLWAGKYASVNHHEYFAEGVQSWFDNNRHDDHDHNHVDTRAELLEYDPRLAALCREVFGDTEFKYEKPQKRLVGHLEGYDPSSAPTFAWPERLKEAQSEIRRKAQARSKAKP